MTEAQREKLLDVKRRCDEIAVDLKAMSEAGFVISLNLNAVLGQCDMFVVKELREVDLGAGKVKH